MQLGEKFMKYMNLRNGKIPPLVTLFFQILFLQVFLIRILYLPPKHKSTIKFSEVDFSLSEMKFHNKK